MLESDPNTPSIKRGATTELVVTKMHYVFSSIYFFIRKQIPRGLFPFYEIILSKDITTSVETPMVVWGNLEFVTPISQCGISTNTSHIKDQISSVKFDTLDICRTTLDLKNKIL